MNLKQYFALAVLFFCREVQAKGNIHDCVGATLALAQTGNGKTNTSCAGCDPALPVCNPGCQNYIKNVYYDCDSVCLPDGYYFDPQSELSGCFSPNQFNFKIKVERCGCDSAPRSYSFLITLFFILIALVSLYCSWG